MKMLTEAEYSALTLGPQTDQELLDAALALVMQAVAKGLVLTIEQRPLQPLAMGNHYTVVNVRKARVAS